MPGRPLTVIHPSKWWSGFVAVATFATFMTGLAYFEELPAVFGVTGFDKAAHFGTAGLLAFFLDGALRRRTLSIGGRVAVPLAGAIVLVPAGLEEFIQRYATYRTSSILDFAADVAGVVVLIPLSRRLAA